MEGGEKIKYLSVSTFLLCSHEKPITGQRFLVVERKHASLLGSNMRRCRTQSFVIVEHKHSSLSNTNIRHGHTQFVVCFFFSLLCLCDCQIGNQNHSKKYMPGRPSENPPTPWSPVCESFYLPPIILPPRRAENGGYVGFAPELPPPTYKPKSQFVGRLRGRFRII